MRYVLIIHEELFLLQLFINNKFVDSVSGKTFPTLHPANGKKIADIAEANKVDSLS
jgi:acyl-CoA reductase-like NAD-dependent aldehyde dehydrogenase